MASIVLSVVFILVLMIGVPVLVLWIRDRGGIVGAGVNKLLGATALLIGLVILGWVVYNFFSPTEEYRRNYHTILQIAVPLWMVWLGWKWLTDQGIGLEALPVDADCDEWHEGVERARYSMNLFLTEVDRNIDGAFVRFPFRMPDGTIEHVWAYVHSFRNGAFNVSIPEVAQEEAGPSSNRPDVPLEEVEDWMIIRDDGRVAGAFTEIAQIQRYEASGRRLSKKMKKQKAAFEDLECHEGVPMLRHDKEAP